MHLRFFRVKGCSPPCWRILRIVLALIGVWDHDRGRIALGVGRCGSHGSGDQAVAVVVCGVAHGAQRASHIALPLELCIGNRL
jgi:hypothetical protein